MDDLWPDDIGDNFPRSPVTVLREQASALGQRTKNIVEADVAMFDIEFSNQNQFFKYVFIIIAPALGKYKYNLFYISHNIQLYPVEFDLDTDIFNEVIAIEGMPNKKASSDDDNPFYIPETKVTAETEEDFLRILKIILNSKKTRNIVSALLSQSVGIERRPAW
jgi:hypothetical protein